VRSSVGLANVHHELSPAPLKLLVVAGYAV
jgi:hypothetical protein